MWKVISNTKGFYEVSDEGEVRSIERLVNYKHGGKPRLWPQKIIKGWIAHNGYKELDLKIEGIKRRVILHRMVSEAFIPNPKRLDYVNHKDGNKLNNNATNLEWCTNSENVIHSFNIGRHSGKGATHYKAKPITDGTNIFGTHQEAGEFYSVSKKVIYDMVSGRTTNKLNLRYL